MPKKKKKALLPNESFEDLIFPQHGINVASEWELPPMDTTPVGINVRAFEPSTMRNRGGSRPGIHGYMPQVPSGHHKIQHLNYIVDPQAVAVMGTYDPRTFGYGGPLITDTSHPDLLVPVGGWGPQPVKAKKIVSGIQFVQVRAGIIFGTTTITGTHTFSFSKDVTKGNLILLNFFHAGSSYATLNDSQGNTYTEIGAGKETYYTFASASGPLTISLLFNGLNHTSAADICMVEYSGVTDVPPIYDDVGLGGGTIAPGDAPTVNVLTNGDANVTFFHVATNNYVNDNWTGTPQGWLGQWQQPNDGMSFSANSGNVRIDLYTSVIIFETITVTPPGQSYFREGGRHCHVVDDLNLSVGTSHLSSTVGPNLLFTQGVCLNVIGNNVSVTLKKA